MNIVSKFGGLVGKVKTPLETLLVVLILINYVPTEVLGTQLNSQFQATIRWTKIHVIMKHVFVRLFLWLVLLWSCCYVKDMKLFFLITIYFVVSGR